MNYFPFHIGDYAVHTRHLSLMEDLAYRRLLDLYYTREHALPAEAAQVARLIGMREHVADVEAVLKEFFVPEEHGDWIHARCEAEIKKAQGAAERARTNGRLGGNPYKREQYNEAGWLYAFEVGDGTVKVGITKNPQQRLYEHRRKHKGVSYLCCLQAADMGATEAALLAHYAAFAVGERLTLTQQQVAQLPAYMESLCTPAGTQTAPQQGGKSKAPITQDQDHTEDKSSVGGAKAPRASRKCPASFVVTPELLTWAASEAPGVPLEVETAKLRDHTFKNAISDWPGAWRNWIRRAHKDAPARGAQTFRERDSEARAARVREMTGGLLDNRDYIDMETGNVPSLTHD